MVGDGGVNGIQLVFKEGLPVGMLYDPKTVGDNFAFAFW
jgi:hypothetical protein